MIFLQKLFYKVLSSKIEKGGRAGGRGQVWQVCFQLKMNALLNKIIKIGQRGPKRSGITLQLCPSINLLFYLLIIQISYFLYNNQLSTMQNQPQTSNLPTLLSTLQLHLKIPFNISQVGLRSSNKYERDGHWNQKERLKYVIFLSFFQGIFSDPSKKKMIRIYQMMSDMIITRNQNQCRSHHQKMLKYRNTIPDIINSVAEKYEPTLFAHLTSKYLVLVKNLLLNQVKYIRVSAEGEKTRYVEACIDFSNPFPKGEVKIEHLDQNEVCQNKGELQKGQKEAEDRRKTNDEYLPNIHYMDQEQHADQLPIIDLPDLKLQEPEKYPTINAKANCQIAINQQQIGVEGLFSLQEGGLTLTAQGRSYYQSQIQLLTTKRQWHTRNIEQLNIQLASEQDSINHCDSTIHLYSLALTNKKRQA